MNPDEPTDFPLGRWNLYIGGAGRVVDGCVNFDLVAMPGVDVAGDAEHLPFPASTFQRVECDAVLEHVRDPYRVMEEMRRVLAPGLSLEVEVDTRSAKGDIDAIRKEQEGAGRAGQPLR